MNQLIVSASVGLLFLFSSASASGAFLPKSFEAKFSDVRGEKEIPVKIKYSFPKKIYYEVEGETPLLYVCNAEKTWKYTPPFMEGEKGELAVGDSSQFCYSRIFDSLSKGLSTNELYKVTTKGKKAELSFKEKAKNQLGLEKIEIEFQKDVDKSSSLSDAKELKMFLSNKPEPVRLVMKEYTKNPAFKKGQFSFSPPKNTNTIQMK